MAVNPMGPNLGGSSIREGRGEVTIVLPAANDRKRGGTIERAPNSVKTVS
jgi:hypothetical protein